MNNVQKILLEARDLYQNNIQNNEKYKNYLNKLRIINLCNISNKLSQYNINLENEKSKVSVVYDSDKNKITTKDVTVRIVHGDNTKIINNNEKNTYTFTQNGSFTFRLSIKGKTHALAVSVKNIKETNVIDLNKKEYKSSIIQLVNEKDSGFISLRNNDFILIIIIIFIITAIITFIKYKRIFR